jgi:NodT family efflux transporter outer membrane factor (OMF) lipoprotein
MGYPQMTAPVRISHRKSVQLTKGAALRVALFACLLTAGCAAGPDFKPPATPAVSDYVAHPVSTTAATPNLADGAAQTFVKGAEVPADWWTLFHSPALNDLIQESLANNHDLKAAQAALLAARENVRAQRGVYYPSVSAGFSATRQLQSASIAPTPSNNAFEYSLFTPQVSVSYVPDVFGLNRRNTELVKAQAQGVRYQLAAAHLTLTTNVAAAFIQEASLQAQIDATRQLVTISTDVVSILKYQISKGYSSRLDLAAQESQLAQTSASLPPLLKQEAQQRDLIAVLVGRFPSQAPTATFELSNLTLPESLPLSLPSALVAQRPDVLQAQANQHAASAQVGVAAANRLPNIELTANAGTTALAISQVFAQGNGFWSLGAAITAPIFQGGALLHQERAAKAAYVQASEQYRSTVLTAFQNVADTLAALEQDAAGLKAAASAADAAKTTLDLTQRQWRDGYANYLALLSAQQAYQQTRIALVQAQAARLADTVALFQALGGGWSRRADIAETKDDH